MTGRQSRTNVTTMARLEMKAKILTIQNKGYNYAPGAQRQTSRFFSGGDPSVND
jgi:hypothetical protein